MLCVSGREGGVPGLKYVSWSASGHHRAGGRRGTCKTWALPPPPPITLPQVPPPRAPYSRIPGSPRNTSLAPLPPLCCSVLQRGCALPPVKWLFDLYCACARTRAERRDPAKRIVLLHLRPVQLPAKCAEVILLKDAPLSTGRRRRRGGYPPLLLRCTAVLTHPWPSPHTRP